MRKFMQAGAVATGLLMLVSAFAGVQTMRDVYNHAIAQKYRFFSYGDAMWLDRTTHND